VAPSLPRAAADRRAASGPTRTGDSHWKALARPERRLSASLPKLARANSTLLSKGSA